MEEERIMEQDIRWIQRYDNYHRACKRILEVTESGRKTGELSELEMEGLIQRFEYTTFHTYNEGETGEVVRQIYETFAPLLKELDGKLAMEKAQIERERI